MKKMAYVLAVMMVFGLVIATIGVAGEMTDIPENIPAKAEDAAALLNAGKNVELTGTILNDNTFVDESGQNYELAASDANSMLQELVGEKIKVQATVMEESEGIRSIVVSSYELIKK